MLHDVPIGHRITQSVIPRQPNQSYNTTNHTITQPNTPLTNKHAQLNKLQTLPLLHANVHVLEQCKQNTDRREEPQRRLFSKETHQAKETENNDIGLVEREEAPADAEGGVVGRETGAIENDISRSTNAAVGEEEDEETGVRLAKERLHGNDLSYEADGGNNDERKDERAQGRGYSIRERAASCRGVDEKKEEQGEVEEKPVDGIQAAGDHQSEEGKDDSQVVQPNDDHRSLAVFLSCHGCGRGSLEWKERIGSTLSDAIW